MKKRLFFQTLGCPKNRVDSEVMLGALSADGYELVARPEDADLMVVNTCSFIEDSKVESIDVIMELAAAKEKAGGRLVVAGCFAQRYHEAIQEEMPEVDVIVGTGEYQRIIDILSDVPLKEGPTVAVARPYYVHNTDTPRLITTPQYTAYLKIAEGCSQRCTFCIIPQIRGKQRSRDVADLVREARVLAEGGVRELNLIAQDLTHYGTDRKDGAELSRLLRGLGDVDGIDWIRMLYCYPHNVTPELVDTIASVDKVVPYIDIPLQHIDDGMLANMQRRTTEKITREILARLRSAVPDLVIRTTFIVGFPGETDSQFKRLADFVAEEAFDHVGVFTYSQEEGTKAAKLVDSVPAEVKTARRDQLMHMQRRISGGRMESMVGREIDVLVEGVSEETELLLQGRYFGQAPDVDGLTYISEGVAVPGALVRARVVQAGDYDLVARLI